MSPSAHRFSVNGNQIETVSAEGLGWTQEEEKGSLEGQLERRFESLKRLGEQQRREESLC